MRFHANTIKVYRKISILNGPQQRIVTVEEQFLLVPLIGYQLVPMADCRDEFFCPASISHSMKQLGVRVSVL
jgi:hypothetical protein